MTNKQIFLISIFFLVMVLPAFSQTPPPSNNSMGAPLDGMTTLLLAGGSALAIKRLRSKR